MGKSKMGKSKSLCAVEIEQCDELADLCRALSHPVRIALLRAIGRQHCCCNDLCLDLPLAQSTVSQHLKILKNAGLIGIRSKAQRNLYYLRPEKLARFEQLILPLFGNLQSAAHETISRDSELPST